MKRLNIIFTLILIFVVSVFPGNVNQMLAQSFAGGSGTEADPWQIEIPEQLNAMRDFLDAHFILNNDIDLSFATGNPAGQFWNDGLGWEPIGGYYFPDVPFTGSLEGTGFTITGLTINRPPGDFSNAVIGLIGALGNDGEINNLGLEEINIVGSPNHFVGGLVGRIEGGIITNCKTVGTLDGGAAVGGLAGGNFDGSITDSHSESDVKGFVAGGLVAGNNGGTITGSSAKGRVEGSSNSVGGLVGHNEEGMIISSFATGRVVGGNNYVGGLVGWNLAGTLENNYAMSSVSGVEYVGGLVGRNDGLITDSYAVGSIYGMEYAVGGVAGSNSGSVTDSYWNTDTDSYWDIEPGGPDNNTGVGLTTAQMLQQSSFEGWDFDNVWAITEGNSFPFLQDNMQNPPPGFFPFAGGSGSEEDPYQVATARQLNTIRYFLYAFAHFILIDDIDLAFETGDPGGEFWNEGLGWEPIGNIYDRFTTTFNGQGHTITGLTINRPSLEYIGLFGALGEGGEIVELALEDVDISGNNRVGGLLGYQDYAQIMNCYVTGSVAGNSNVGGLVGYNGFSSAIINSYATASVSGSSSVGGLVGFESASTITSSYWNIDAGGPDNGLGEGLTSVEMQQQSSFTGWDFVDTWQIDEGLTFPYLRNDPQSPDPGYVPVFVSLNPGNNAIEAPIDLPVSVVFNMPISPANLSQITIKNSSGGPVSNVAGTINDTSLNISHDNFAHDETYTVAIPAGTVENAGGTGNEEISWGFTTILAAPVAASLSPAEDTFGVALNAPVSVTFSQAVNAVDLSGVSITDESGTEAGNVSATLTGSTVNISHDDFAPGITFTVSVPAAAVENADGVENGAVSWSFMAILGDIDVQISQTFGEVSSSGDYRLVALPGQAEVPLADALSGQSGITWKAFWDNGADQDYLVEYDGSSAFNLKPGNGFWVTSKEAFEYSQTVAPVELNDDGRAMIPLHSGWNIISNPLDIGVAWTHVSAANGDNLQPAWGFDGSYSEASGFASAKSGQAFYFLNDQGLDTLLIPYTVAPGKVKPVSDRRELTLITSVDGRQTSSSNLVFADSGTDVVAPPAGFEQASIRFATDSDDRDYDRAGSFARIYRSYDQQGQRFEVILSGVPGIPVVITAERWDAGLSEELALIDPGTGRKFDLLSGMGLTITPVEEQTALLLVMGDSEYVDRQQREFLPEQIDVSPNYPNPFNPATTLQFALPEQASVRVQVYDILGRRVSTLINNEVRQAGIHTVTFDASRQASGMYITVFEIGSRRFVQKMLLIK